MSRFPLARLLEFVRSTPPFDVLDEEEASRVVGAMAIRYVPRGTPVFAPGAASPADLHLIHSGSARVVVEGPEGQEVLVDVRGEGETLGGSGPETQGEGAPRVMAQEDLLIFTLPRAEYLRLVETYPEVGRHFVASWTDDAASFADPLGRQLWHLTGVEALGETARHLHTRVGELMTREVLTCPPETPIAQAAQLMTAREVGSIVVAAADGEPLGVVTDTDLRQRVLAVGRDPAAPVAEVMTSPLKTVGPHILAFEALLEMTRQKAHHLVVQEAGGLLGVISDHDIKILTGSAPVELVRRVERASDADQLARLPRRILRSLQMLLRMGVSAEYLTGLLADYYDAFVVRLIHLALDQMGPPPAPWAWLAVGRAGRREPIPPLQENIIVFGSLPPAAEEKAQGWFQELASRVSRGMSRCGMPPRRLEPLDDPAKSCRSLPHWKASLLKVIREPDPDQIARAHALLDFREVIDGEGLAAALHEAVEQAVARNPRFLSFMARSGLESIPPLAFLRGEVVEKDGSRHDRLDLERRLIMPVVDAARVMALDWTLESTTTAGRLVEAGERGRLDSGLAADLGEAFRFLTLWRLARYLESRAREEATSEEIEIAQLTSQQRKVLKDCFAVVGRLHEFMAERYAGGNPVAKPRPAAPPPALAAG